MNKIIFPHIEEYLQSFTEFDIHATQLASGLFLCQQRELQLPKLTVGDRFVSTSIQYHSILKQDYFYIVIPRHPEGLVVNGQTRLFNQPLVLTTNQEMLIRAHNNFYNFHLSISKSELEKYLGEESIEQIKTNIELQNISMKNFIHSNNNLQKLCSLIDFLLNQSESLSYQTVFDTQERILILLCNFLNEYILPNQNINIKKPRRLAIVYRSLKYIHKNSTLDMTIPELAQASFCCIRSLEYAFKSIMGISPKQYLMKRRLQLIHSLLQIKQRVSINDIMTSFGIVNQGRFAQEYFNFFNEYPHQTINNRS